MSTHETPQKWSLQKPSKNQHPPLSPQNMVNHGGCATARFQKMFFFLCICFFCFYFFYFFSFPIGSPRLWAHPENHVAQCRPLTSVSAGQTWLDGWARHLSARAWRNVSRHMIGGNHRGQKRKFGGGPLVFRSKANQERRPSKLRKATASKEYRKRKKGMTLGRVLRNLVAVDPLQKV